MPRHYEQGGKEKGVSFIKEVSIKVRKFKKAGTPFEALVPPASLLKHLASATDLHYHDIFFNCIFLFSCFYTIVCSPCLIVRALLFVVYCS